ncbi:ribonuclease H-like domain-containing protein [Tanacetum coccineum]
MLSRSSAEIKYRGVANAVVETCWLRNLLRELHTPLSSTTLVYCDNVSVVYLSSNLVQHQHTKHIDIHFVQDLFVGGQVRVIHVPSRYQYANIFTKGFPSALFEEFRTSLSVRLLLIAYLIDFDILLLKIVVLKMCLRILIPKNYRGKSKDSLAISVAEVGIAIAV